MKEYKIISSHLPNEFTKLVSDALKEGWQLVGGVSVYVVPTSMEGVYQNIYTQALAK